MQDNEAIETLEMMLSIPMWTHNMQEYFIRLHRDYEHLTFTKEDELRQFVSFRALATRLIGYLKAKEEYVKV